MELAARHHVFCARQCGGAGLQRPVGGRAGGNTYNLSGHALRKALSMIARQQGQGLAAVAQAAGAKLLNGSSLKAAWTWTGMTRRRGPTP